MHFLLTFLALFSSLACLLPLFLMTIFTGYKILGWQIFFFQHLRMPFYHLLVCIYNWCFVHLKTVNNWHWIYIHISQLLPAQTFQSFPKSEWGICWFDEDDTHSTIQWWEYPILIPNIQGLPDSSSWTPYATHLWSSLRFKYIWSESPKLLNGMP